MPDSLSSAVGEIRLFCIWSLDVSEGIDVRGVFLVPQKGVQDFQQGLFGAAEVPSHPKRGRRVRMPLQKEKRERERKEV